MQNTLTLFLYCFRRDGGFTGLLNEIANSDAEGTWDTKVFCYTQHRCPTHLLHIQYVYIHFLYLSSCSTKVAVSHLWLYPGIAPEGFFLSWLPVSSPHSKFHLLVKIGCWRIPLIYLLFNCLSMFSIVEQRGHDCWVFTGLKLVSSSFEMVV